MKDRSEYSQFYKRNLNGQRESILKIAKKYGYKGIEYNTKSEQIQCDNTDTCGYHCVMRYLTYFKFDLLTSAAYVKWIKKITLMCKLPSPDYFVYKFVKMLLIDNEATIKKFPC